MWTLLEDLRYAARVLRKNPGLTAVAMLSLGLGIGANSAIFSLADAMMFRPLAVPHPEQIADVFSSTREESFGGLSYPEYQDYRDQSKVFSGLVAYQFIPVNFSSRGAAPGTPPEIIHGMIVSG